MHKRQVNYIIIIVSVLLSLGAKAQDPNFHIYLCFGQSNMAGAGDIETQDLIADSRFQFMKPQDCTSENEYAGTWYDAVPPLWGCSGGIGPSDYFGRTMVENLPENVRVGVVVVGVPGCKIELFGKTGYEGEDTYNYVPAQYNGSAYAWLLDLAQEAQEDGVIKGFLLHQGESNTGDQQWPTKVKTVYDDLIVDLGLNATEIPLLAGEMLYQDQGGVCWGHNSIIATLPNTLPNSYVISAEGLPGKDQYHFNSEGNRTFGVRYAQQMLAIQPIGPSIIFTSPTITDYASTATVTFDVETSASSGSVSHIDFFINDETTSFHEEWSAPYAFEHTFDQPGLYSIKAIVYDDDGNTGEDIITIIVNVPQAPFGGTAWSIPGTIEFEDFDEGGNGFAYYDTSIGNDATGNYRPDEDVDIEDCDEGGYNLGWTVAGEWLEYTVNVETAGTYNILIRAASDGEGKTISLAMDDSDIASDIEIPNTTGWQIWEDIIVENIQLQAGEQVLRLTIGAADYVNLNNITFTLVEPPATIQLKAGWNMIGYPFSASAAVENALISIQENLLYIKDNDGFYDSNSSPTLNSLTELEYGKGYFVKVDADCDLIWNH